MIRDLTFEELKLVKFLVWDPSEVDQDLAEKFTYVDDGIYSPDEAAELHAKNEYDNSGGEYGSMHFHVLTFLDNVQISFDEYKIVIDYDPIFSAKRTGPANEVI
jgi:hypothetical protein